jgi:hypothetical protein
MAQVMEGNPLVTLPDFKTAPIRPYKWKHTEGQPIYPTEREARRAEHGLAMHGEAGLWEEDTHRWKHSAHKRAVEMLTGPMWAMLHNPSYYLGDLLMVAHEHAEDDY